MNQCGCGSKKDCCSNENNCPCTEKCERHGICCECISYHRKYGGKPVCL